MKISASPRISQKLTNISASASAALRQLSIGISRSSLRHARKSGDRPNASGRVAAGNRHLSCQKHRRQDVRGEIEMYKLRRCGGGNHHSEILLCVKRMLSHRWRAE